MHKLQSALIGRMWTLGRPWGGGEDSLCGGRDVSEITHFSSRPLLKFPPTWASPCVENGPPRLAPWNHWWWQDAYQICADLCVCGRWRTVRVPWWAQTTERGVTTILREPTSSSSPACWCGQPAQLPHQTKSCNSHGIQAINSWCFICHLAHKAILVSSSDDPLTSEQKKMKEENKKLDILWTKTFPRQRDSMGHGLTP